MPLLTCDDPLPGRPRRVIVAGTSGSGKSTIAARIAAVLDVPYLEIDSLFHGPGWVKRPTFEADVHRFTAQPAWVTEWMYDAVRAHLADRADLLVWLDLSRRRVMRQIVRRTLVRRLRRQELWNGNTEPPLRSIFTDRDHIIRWAWSTYGQTATRVTTLMRTHPDLTVVRLRSHRQSARWLTRTLPRSVG